MGRNLMIDNAKLKWTLDLILKLQSTNIGDKDRLDSIKTALESGKTIEDNDKNYLKELYTQLQNSSKESTMTSEVQRDLTLITRLEKAEIGNSAKLQSIKNSLNRTSSFIERGNW